MNNFYPRIYRRWMFRLIVALMIGGVLWLLARVFV